MKAVIYCRVSDSRTSQDSQSCETQEELCRSWAHSMQMTVASVHHDKSISGKTAANRPGLQEAINQAIRHKGVLVCYSLSRFARNLRETLHLADILKEQKANLACVKEQFDTSSYSGKFVFHLFAALQEMEREQIAARTRDAMLQHQANGRRMSDRAPYGWRVDPNDPKRIIEDAEEQRAMRQVAVWKTAGNTLEQICGKLNAAGVKYRGVMDREAHHNEWTRLRVFRVLARAEKAGLYKRPEKKPKIDAPGCPTIDDHPLVNTTA